MTMPCRTRVAAACLSFPATNWTDTTMSMATQHSHTAPTNQALASVADGQRVFGWNQHAGLWFSLGVGLLVMQIGAYLVPSVGTQEALLAIIVGSVIGAGLLAWIAHMGCISGLSSAGLIHATYGRFFARVPVLLNVIQLLGWTTFELVIMREGTVNILAHVFGPGLADMPAQIAATLFWGLIIIALLAGSMVRLVRRIVSRITLPLVILSLVWLSWQFIGQLGHGELAAFWNHQGNGTMGLFTAFDLVIAMPVSWLPLVADYARHGKSGRGTFIGTWLGYTLANIWCYTLGMLVVTVAPTDAGLVSALLLAQGGLIALGFILIDELDNAYGDVYSGSVCTHSLVPRWSIRRWGLTLACVSILLALTLPMRSLEPFLLMLSSVFVPLYGVILGRLGAAPAHAIYPKRGVNMGAVFLWLLGIAIYQGLSHWAPAAGSALPTLFITFSLAFLTRPEKLPAATHSSLS